MKQLYINPVYKKELKTSVRSMKIALTLLAYNGLLALIGLISFYALFESARYNGMDHGLILMIYAILVVMEFGLILFVIPAYTSSAISGERERQTLEILLTTSMKPSQIIRGKLFSSISTVLLLVFFKPSGAFAGLFYRRRILWGFDEVCSVGSGDSRICRKLWAAFFCDF